MTQRRDEEIRTIRKSGRLDEAFELAQQSLEEAVDNIWLKREIGWVYYAKAKSLADTGNSALQEIGSRPLVRRRANLLAIKHAQNRNICRGLRLQKTLGAAPCAFQIINGLGGEEFLIQSPNLRILPHKQIQVMSQNLAAG